MTGSSKSNRLSTQPGPVDNNRPSRLETTLAQVPLLTIDRSVCVTLLSGPDCAHYGDLYPYILLQLETLREGLLYRVSSQRLHE